MKFYHVFVTVAAILLMVTNVSAQEKTDASASLDVKEIMGTWDFVSGKKAGVDSTEERLSGFVTIDEEAFTMPTGEGSDPFVMAYEIDTSQSPAHIDFTITAGPAPEGEAKGIIAFEGDRLMVCYNPFGGDRPTAFESTEANSNFMFAMERGGMSADDLVGTWRYTSGTRAGEEVDAERLNAGGNVEITTDKFHVPAGEEAFIMSYELDSSTTPVSIDLSIDEGPAPEGTALGIIKMEDGKLVFCYDSLGQNRPVSFESDEGNGFFLFELERVEED
ncbi:MAG: TIGR03067 domain-containing protein [Pirellulaceae bacterium]